MLLKPKQYYYIFVLFLLITSGLYVQSITPAHAVNKPYVVKADVATANQPVKFTFSLSQSVPYIAGNIPVSQGYTGKDTYIVIIDTGVETTHPFFKDKVVLEACFATLCPNNTNQMIGPGAAKPVHWHGTHVAGIAAGKGTTFNGVAPDAKIIAVNVFDSTLGAYDSDIVRALNWVASIAPQYNISSINMSLGSSAVFTSTCDNYIPSMTLAIKALRDLNIATIVSAGNSYAFGMSSPACISHSVSVASTYTNSTTIADYSNVSQTTTIAAPGTSITSSSTGATYRTASGTSMAAPHVTGAFALYRSAFGKQSVSNAVSAFVASSKTSYDQSTGISLPFLHMEKMFTQTPVTTTTLPTVTTTSLVSTTTTQPVVTTTTTLPKPSLPRVLPPILLDLDGRYKTFVWVKYKDPYIYKSYIQRYELVCNGTDTYIIPVNSKYSLQNYKLQVPASNITYCYMYGVLIDNTKTSSTPIKKIYPRNTSLSSKFRR